MSQHLQQRAKADRASGADLLHEALPRPWETGAFVLSADPLQQPLLTPCAPAVVSAEPLQRVGVALAQVAGGACRHQVLPRRDAAPGKRSDVIKCVRQAAAVGAVGAPVGEDPAPQPGLAFALRHQLGPVDVVVEHAVISNPSARADARP